MSTVTITDLARENVRNLTPYQSARRLVVTATSG